MPSLQSAPPFTPSKLRFGLAEDAECQEKGNLTPDVAALGLDMSVLSSLLSATASTLMRTQPLAFREALQIESAGLIAIAEIDPSYQGRLVADLLAEWIKSLSQET